MPCRYFSENAGLDISPFLGVSMKLLSALLVGALVVAIPASAQVFTRGPGLALAIPDNTYNGTNGSMLCDTIVVPSGGGGGNTVDNVTAIVVHYETDK